jgi:FkbM family methyltransferase
MDNLLRMLPSFRGKQRMANLILKGKLASEKNIWIKGRYDCEYLLPNLRENISRDIYLNGVYEAETIRFLAKMIPPNGNFLDLGANIGAITIPLNRRRKDIHTIAVEASPRVYDYLAQNIERNGLGRIQLVNKALYYEDGVELDFYSPEEKFGKGSLSPVFTDRSEKTVTIKVDTLLKELNMRSVDMIKIDVEGYEHQVFKGAPDLLASSTAPDILFEFVDWAEGIAQGKDVGAEQELLLQHGYKIYYFSEKKEALTATTGIVRSGEHLLFATKKVL